MSITDVLTLATIVVMLATAIVPWLFQVHAKLAVIAQRMETLVQFTDECRQANQQLDERIDELENQFHKHEQILRVLTK